MPAVVTIVYWQDDDGWIGYLRDHPAHWTQGETLEDLRDHLRDLHFDLSGERLPAIRIVETLDIP